MTTALHSAATPAGPSTNHATATPNAAAPAKPPALSVCSVAVPMEPGLAAERARPAPGANAKGKQRAAQASATAMTSSLISAGH
eukprot:CAMPEP_0197649610 /NCGR_PEP_ID=MMETSP1338-20131121/29013_1 /TAXON_ID=43686 ORGANISM="Pelagodinium beii, Strain RCC1491" /NCGR_SAMPLE_ID=MMETSP1338 /ASSEMBLY_ACC=CAM_ASM_000754 /LENGTH=83 /DNA_ID=CAMNT_0043223841 /DNA_START=169 /DNA_END=421 /DNA_ORIENTATION=-